MSMKPTEQDADTAPDNAPGNATDNAPGNALGTEEQEPAAAADGAAEAAAEPAAAADGMPQAPGQVAAGDAAAELAMRVPELEAEVAELKDRLLRAMAETENVRRRAARDREDASKYAIANFAREVLGVADNLRRALDSVDADTRAGNEALETLAVGVEMTERELLASMERVGIRPIEAMGKRFDHNFHEAMFEIEDPSQPAGTVLQELQAGYMLGERLLRPSRVGVSKGGPKEPPAAAPAEGETDPAGTGAKDPYDKKPGAAGGTLDEEL